MATISQNWNSPLDNPYVTKGLELTTTVVSENDNSRIVINLTAKIAGKTKLVERIVLPLEFAGHTLRVSTVQYVFPGDAEDAVGASTPPIEAATNYATPIASSGPVIDLKAFFASAGDE